METRSRPAGAIALTPFGTGAAGDAIEKVFRGPELVQHVAPPEHVARRRRDGHLGQVTGVRAAPLDVVLGVGVPIVQVERERGLAAARRENDDDAQRRVLLRENVAEDQVRLDADAENRRTAHLDRLGQARLTAGRRRNRTSEQTDQRRP